MSAAGREGEAPRRHPEEGRARAERTPDAQAPAGRTPAAVAGTPDAHGWIDSLDHVQLAVPPGSEDALRAYYADTLGMTELPKPPKLAARGGCWFAAGSAVLHLGVEEGFRPARKAHPGIRVRGIDTLAARLAAAGAPVEWDAALPGHRRFYSQDPAGNRLEFLEPADGG